MKTDFSTSKSVWQRLDLGKTSIVDEVTNACKQRLMSNEVRNFALPLLDAPTHIPYLMLFFISFWGGCFELL